MFFYDNLDIALTNMFEIDDLFFSKVNVMKSNFTYFCDVFPNGYSVCADHFIHKFDINLVQTESFNLGIYDNSKNIFIAFNLNYDERIKMEEILRKR